MLVIKRVILLLLAGVGGILSAFGLHHNNAPVKTDVIGAYDANDIVVEMLYNNSSGSAEAIIKNNCEYTLKSFYVEVYTNKECLIFETTMLPPFSYVLLQSRSGDKATDLNIRDVIVYTDIMIHSEGYENIQTIIKNSNELVICNNTNIAYSADVYIKPWIENKEMYTGNTEKIVIRNLQSGDSVCVPVSYKEYKVVFIDQK